MRSSLRKLDKKKKGIADQWNSQHGEKEAVNSSKVWMAYIIGHCTKKLETCRLAKEKWLNEIVCCWNRKNESHQIR